MALKRERMKQMKKTNIRAVAARAGVSPATASRVFNGNKHVNPQHVAVVMEAAQELGYRVSVPCGSYAKQIVYIVPALSMTNYTDMLDGAIAVATEHGMSITVKITHSDHEQELSCLREACSPSTAGIIFTPATALDPLAEIPVLGNIPLVLVGPRLINSEIPNLYQDSFSAGYLGTKYLLRLGHRRIAFFANFWQEHIHSFAEFMRERESSSRCYFSVYDRFDGYCRALEEEGLSPEKDLIFFGTFSYESGCGITRRLLASAVEFDAVLAPNDRVGAGVLKVLREQGFRVPGDASIVCLTGSLISDMVYPRLTVVESNNYQIGQTAAEHLMRLMRGESVPNVKGKTRLVIKDSTRAVR